MQQNLALLSQLANEPMIIEGPTLVHLNPTKYCFNY